MSRLLKLATLAVLGLACGWLSAQTLTAYPTAPIAPRGSYQTVTAIVNGVNNKTITWSTDCGTIVGTNPGTLNEPNTIALYDTTAETCHLTATSNANGSVHTTIPVVFTASPSPTTDHPRFLVNSSNLAAMRAKGIAGNPLYTPMKNRAASYLSADSSIWTFSTWNGSACVGGSGPSSDQSGNFRQNDMFWMSIVALFDSDAATRNIYGCAARDILLTVAGYVISGAIPAGDANQWSGSAQQFVFTPDYVMSYLSSSDLTTVRSYLAKVEYVETNNISNSGNGPIIGTLNDPVVQFAESNSLAATGMRAMGNNYTQTRILAMAGAALLFNDNTTDDPPLSNTCSATRYQVCPDGTAGSLHAYWYLLNGSMLYRYWAAAEDPGVTQAAYNAAYSNMASPPLCDALWGGTVPCLGGIRGGEAPEGPGYGNAAGATRWALDLIHTAGYDDPLLYGPQISFGTSSYWPLRYVADISLLTGLSGISSQASRWNYLTSGDSDFYYTYTNNYQPESALMTGISNSGSSDASFAGAEWLTMNAAFGMAAGTTGGCTESCGFLNALTNTNGANTNLDFFLTLPASDPTGTPADPRSSLPSDWYSAGNQHIVARDGTWGTGTGTVFSSYCTNTQIDHEHQFCGGFDLYSNGEYITKGRTEFNDYNDAMSLARFKNTLELIQIPGTACGPSPVSFCTFWQATLYGGQFWHGNQAGLVNLYHAELPAYVAAEADDTNGYNGGSGIFANWNLATGASSSLLYLRGGKEIIAYDRGATGSNTWDKSVYMIATGAPTITTNTATWLTRSGTQKAVYTSLLPANPVNAHLPVNTTVTGAFSSLQSGTTEQLTCTASFADGGTGNVTSQGVWTSDNPAVATVSSTGLVTAVSVGSVGIACNYMLGVNAPITVVSGSSSGSINVTGNHSNQLDDWEPYTLLQVDAGNVTSARFLTDLQWGTSGFSPSSPTLVQSTAGQNFDGVLTAGETTVAMFMRNWPTTFTGTTYPASGATTQYVSDLTPNTTYSISGAGAPATATTDNAGTMTFAATGTGNIVISTGGTPTAATPTFSPPGGTHTGTQTVTISTISPGAILCYTTDGSTPATNGTTGCTTGTLYSAPISVAVSETVKAIAGGTGWLDSGVGSATYTIVTPSTGSISISGATISGSISIQ